MKEEFFTELRMNLVMISIQNFERDLRFVIWQKLRTLPSWVKIRELFFDAIEKGNAQ